MVTKMNLATKIILIICIIIFTVNSNVYCANKNQTISKISSREIANKVIGSLILITVHNKKGETVSQGSGFILDENIVVTNLHIFKQGATADIKVLKNGKIFKIDDVNGVDINHDICLINIQGLKLNSLKVADLSKIAVGDEVYVGGNPMGLEATVSKGIVSSMRDNQGLIQIDAAISPGSSGGPVVNSNAEVIGIASSMIPGGQNLNFAVPISYIKNIGFSGDIPIFLAGALSVSDKEMKNLVGSVKLLIEESPDLTRTYFNEKGMTIKTEMFIANSLFLKCIIEYGTNGLPLKNTCKIKDGDETITEFKTSEAINFLIEKQSGFSITKKGEKFADSKIDEYGNAIEDNLWYDNNHFKFLTKYKKRGIKSTKTIFNNGEMTSECKYSYEFDEYGNWISEVENCMDIIGKSKKTIKSREIQYF